MVRPILKEKILLVTLWCNVYFYFTALLNKALTQVLRLANGY